MNFIFAKTFLKKYYYYSWASALLSWVVFSFQTTLISLWDQWYTTVYRSDTHTHKLKQQFSYTLAYIWVGWTLTCFGCGAGEDIILYNLVNLLLDQQSLWISLQSWVNFGAFQVQWINREGEIKQNKAYANNNGFMLFHLVLDDEKGLEWLCFTYTRKLMFQHPRQI